MSNKFKDIDIKATHYWYKKFWYKQVNEKSQKHVFVYCTGYVTIKLSNYEKN